LAWEAAAEPEAAAGRVQAAAQDLAAQVVAEQVQVARACGKRAGRPVAARAAAQEEERELALAQAPEAAEVQVTAQERAEEVVSEAREPAGQEALAEEVALDLEGLVVDRAPAAERGQAPGQKNPANG
jgi:hypothetical protein